MTNELRDELKLDYAETIDFIRMLTDVRFKLLAFVPTISGAAIGFLGRTGSTAELLAVGLIGLTATFGVVLYELRNTQLSDYALARARELERELELRSFFDRTKGGGLFSERPGRDIRIFGFAVGHDRGLSLVYGAAIGGWVYTVAWGALRALGVANAQKIGGAVGIVLGLVVLVEFLRLDTRPPATREAPTGTLPAAP